MRKNISPWGKGFNKMFTPASVLIFLALGANALVEYEIGGISVFFIKDLINIGVIALVLCLFLVKQFSNQTVFAIAIYSIIISVMVSLPFRIQNTHFQFESYFLKVEMIVILLALAIGLLVKLVHMAVILGVNMLFIAVCAIMQKIDYPIGKFIFYILMTTGAGSVAYKIHEHFNKLVYKLNGAYKTIANRNVELKELNSSKDHILRIIGHDLRTPFVHLMSLSTLFEEAETEEEKKKFTSMIKTTATQGDQLLISLLDWSKSESMKSMVKLEIRSVNEIVSRIFSFFSYTSQTKDILLVDNVEPNLELKMDVRMMETVIRNLISNAMKFSKRGSEIIIHSEVEKNEVKISVIDQGVGMDEYVMKGLFQVGKSNSRPGTENEAGTGFGLNICKGLIEEQKGRIGVSSIPNVGTTMSIYMPRAT